MPAPIGRSQSIALGLLWLGFVTYALLLSPPAAPNTLEVIRQLSTGQWADLNPVVVVLFNLMGLWPMVYASLALSDGVDQRLSAWPFVVGSFGLGAFALMPYLALRKSTSNLPQPAVGGPVLKVITHRLWGVGVAISTVLLMVYGITQGAPSEAWQEFLHQFSTSQFIHVMSLDFCMLCAVVGPLLKSDMAKRTLNNPVLFWSATLIPLLGIAFYLSVRPPLPTLEETPETA